MLHQPELLRQQRCRKQSQDGQRGHDSRTWRRESGTTTEHHQQQGHCLLPRPCRHHEGMYAHKERRHPFPAISREEIFRLHLSHRTDERGTHHIRNPRPRFIPCETAHGGRGNKAALVMRLHHSFKRKHGKMAENERAEAKFCYRVLVVHVRHP